MVVRILGNEPTVRDENRKKTVEKLVVGFVAKFHYEKLCVNYYEKTRKCKQC